MRVCCLRYQWDVQATVLRIATSMRDRGFNVWMDTEMMSGSTLDAMAAAVEDAHCILICITERYKARGRCDCASALALRPAGCNHVLGAPR
jgi:phosphopantothenate-cysteine ligase